MIELKLTPNPNPTYTPAVKKEKEKTMDQEEKRIYKGDCGLCGSPVFSDDVRYKRPGEGVYICEDCFNKWNQTVCIDCPDLFSCDRDAESQEECKEEV